MVKGGKRVTIHTRAAEHPGHFRVDDGILFCIYCNHGIKWEKKSTVDDHVRGPIHCAKKVAYENQQKQQKDGGMLQQRTIASTISIADKKKELIGDLIQAFATANIPLEKVNSLLPFFQKHVKQGGFIPQASTLRQIYLPQAFENHFMQLKLLFENKPVAITMDETTDDCARSVVNTIFHFQKNTKLVSVDFLTQVNNSTIGTTLITILTNYNISFSMPRLFLSDSASYMKKCYREVLKPIMPQLIHVPCCAHILNLIGETWQKFHSFDVLKKFLASVKECFIRSPARRCRYLTYLRSCGISSPCKIPLPTATRWNSWFRMVEYTKIHLPYWSSFFQDELANDSTNETLKKISKSLTNAYEFGIISIFIHFISIYAKQFVQDTDFFQQQNKPVIPFVEGRLNHLSAFLKSNCNSQDFGPDLDATITLHHFKSPDFYPVFHSAFKAAFNKFNAHFPSHPARSLFHATQIFNPKYILLGPLERRNLRQYSVIKELANPSDELLCEWSTYCGLELENLGGEINLEEYWMDLEDKLPILSKIALDYIWLPISSCSVERSFSIYNNVLDENRQNLSKDSLKKLNMMYFNGS